MAQIIDASVAIAWCATSQASPLTTKALRATIDRGAEVPPLFWFEVLYGLEKLVRKRSIERIEIEHFVVLLSNLSLIIHEAHTTAHMLDLYAMARRYEINIYDAAYLELALRTNLPLATRDDALARATLQAGALLFTA